MESALPPKILQGEHSSLVYVLLQTPSWASWKVLVEHGGKENISRRSLWKENEKKSIGYISLFVQQKMVSLQGVELDSSADEAD